MAARDHFTIKLRCPKCGREGVAQVSEDDYPFMSNPRFAVHSLPDGFYVKKRHHTSNGTEIACSECEELAQ